MPINPYLAVLSIVFATAETAYFGWNWTAKSPEEYVCDGIALGIMALAIAFPGDYS